MHDPSITAELEACHTPAYLWALACTNRDPVEADEVLPVKYAELHPRGMEILGLLADGPTPVGAGGDPATMKDLDLWIQTYDSEYPSAIEPPPRLLAAPFGTQLPGNMIIDTATMTIVQRINGQPDQSFWSAADAFLRP